MLLWSLELWGCVDGAQLNPKRLSSWWREILLGFGFLKVVGALFAMSSWIELIVGGCLPP